MEDEKKFKLLRKPLSKKQKEHIAKQKKFLSTLFGEPKQTLFDRYEAETRSLIIHRYERGNKHKR